MKKNRMIAMLAAALCGMAAVTASLPVTAADGYYVLDRNEHHAYYTTEPLNEELQSIMDGLRRCMTLNGIEGSVWIYSKDGTQTVAAICESTADWSTLQTYAQKAGLNEDLIIYDAVVYPCEDVQYTTVEYDYPYYQNADALLEKANCLFEGAVRSIHFEMHDFGGQPMLYTYYEIEVQKRYCDTVSFVVTLRVEGGIKNDYLTEQLALTDSIPLVEGMPTLKVGDKRLFALYQAEGAEYASILNPQQSIYAAGDTAEDHGGISSDDLLPDAAASYHVLDRDKHISYLTDAPLPDEVCTTYDYVSSLMTRNSIPGRVWIYLKDGEMTVAAVCAEASDWATLRALVEQYGMPENAVPFTYDAVAYTCGDLNLDGAVNASDAANVLIAAAKLGAGKDSGLTENQLVAADINFDDIVNASDAAIILQRAAEAGAQTSAKANLWCIRVGEAEPDLESLLPAGSDPDDLIQFH